MLDRGFLCLVLASKIPTGVIYACVTGAYWFVARKVSSKNTLSVWWVYFVKDSFLALLCLLCYLNALGKYCTYIALH